MIKQTSRGLSPRTKTKPSRRLITSGKFYQLPYYFSPLRVQSGKTTGTHQAHSKGRPHENRTADPQLYLARQPGELAGKLAEIARTADEAGFASLWVMDHFFQIGSRDRSEGLGPAEDEMLEGYSTLSYLAGVTKKVKLGTLVTGVIYRYPGILVKTVTTLDVLSGGRAYLGIGAAWNEREARGLGVPFPR